MNLWHSQKRIDSYLAGEVRGEAGLRAHLKTCPRCRAHYDAGVLALRAARGDIKEAGAGELERLMRRASAVASRARTRRAPLATAT